MYSCQLLRVELIELDQIFISMTMSVHQFILSDNEMATESNFWRNEVKEVFKMKSEVKEVFKMKSLKRHTTKQHSHAFGPLQFK